MNIRKMNATDISTIAELEQQCFPKPWNERMIYEEFTNNQRADFFVAEIDGIVVGHIGIWKTIDRVHITTIAVKPECRRKGVATAMVNHIIDKQSRNQRIITLEVRPSNKAARNLYESLDFASAGRRKNYYSDNNEDAIIMNYDPVLHDEIDSRHERSRRN